MLGCGISILGYTPNPLWLWVIFLSSIGTFMLTSTSKIYFNYVLGYRNALRLIATRIFSPSIFGCELWLSYRLNCNRRFGFPNLDNHWFRNHNRTAPNRGNTTLILPDSRFSSMNLFISSSSCLVNG